MAAILSALLEAPSVDASEDVNLSASAEEAHFARRMALKPPINPKEFMADPRLVRCPIAAAAVRSFSCVIVNDQLQAINDPVIFTSDLSAALIVELANRRAR